MTDQVVKQKEAEKAIAGVPISKIRKAFFNGKLQEVMAEMQSKGEVTKEDMVELDVFLTDLQLGAEKMEQSLKRYMPEAENAREQMFLSEVLGEELTEEDRKIVAEEKSSYTFAVETVTDKMKERANQYYMRKNIPTSEDLMDDAMMFVNLEYYIDGQEIILKQLYKKKVAELILKGHQRKQAEDLAMLTAEYRRWQDVYRLRERMLEYIMLAKKRFSGQFV